MKNNCKNTIIVITCIATALICIVLTFWGNLKNDGVLTTDAFVGIIAAFIGVCATIIVGIQIVSFIDLRDVRTQIKTIQEERMKLKNQQDIFSNAIHNTRVGLGDALALSAMTARTNNNDVIEFESWVISIVIDDWNSSNKGATLLNRYKRLLEIADKVVETYDLTQKNRIYHSLSILDIPTDIENYNYIMALHHQLLSKLSSSNQTTE